MSHDQPEAFLTLMPSQYLSIEIPTIIYIESVSSVYCILTRCRRWLPSLTRRTEKVSKSYLDPESIVQKRKPQAPGVSWNWDGKNKSRLNPNQLVYWHIVHIIEYQYILTMI